MWARPITIFISSSRLVSGIKGAQAKFGKIQHDRRTGGIVRKPPPALQCQLQLANAKAQRRVQLRERRFADPPVGFEPVTGLKSPDGGHQRARIHSESRLSIGTVPAGRSPSRVSKRIKRGMPAYCSPGSTGFLVEGRMAPSSSAARTRYCSSALTVRRYSSMISDWPQANRCLPA